MITCETSESRRRGRLSRLCEIYRSVSGVASHQLPRRYRLRCHNAITATAVALQLEFSVYCSSQRLRKFLPLDLKKPLFFLRAALSAVDIVVEPHSHHVYRVVGDRSLNIAILDGYSERELRSLERDLEHRDTWLAERKREDREIYRKRYQKRRAVELERLKSISPELQQQEWQQEQKRGRRAVARSGERRERELRDLSTAPEFSHHHLTERLWVGRSAKPHRRRRI